MLNNSSADYFWRNPDLLTSLLGSFWKDFLEDDQDLLKSIIEAVTAPFLQNYKLLSFLFRSTCRHKIEPLYEISWYPLKIKKSQLTYKLPQYLSNTTYNYSDSNPDIFYGINIENLELSYKLPDFIRDFNVICNSIHNSSTVLTKGTDFYISTDKHELVFSVDIFSPDDNLFPVKEIKDPSSGEVIDKEITLWLNNVKIDKQFLYNLYGYAVSLYYPKSNENYKNLINSVYDLYLLGSQVDSLQKFISSALDLPLSQFDGETVQDIVVIQNEMQLITDKNVYFLHPLSTLSYNLGDTIPSSGLFLSDTVKIYPLYRYDFYGSELPGISIDNDLLPSDFKYDLYFENKNYNLEVVNYNGIFHIRFPIQGHPDDVNKFWQYFYSRAGSQSTLQLFYNYYGITNVINPMRFICDNILRNNALLIKIKSNLVGKNALGLHYIKYIRNYLPPHVLCLFRFEFVTQDVFDPNSYVNENVGLFQPTNATEIIDPTSDITENIVVYNIIG